MKHGAEMGVPQLKVECDVISGMCLFILSVSVSVLFVSLSSLHDTQLTQDCFIVASMFFPCIYK